MDVRERGSQGRHLSLSDATLRRAYELRSPVGDILRLMAVLRADPWDPGYGMGFEAVLPDDPADTHPFVETEDWSKPICPRATHRPKRLWFVDGVLRVELRLLAEEDGRRAPGLFGSYASGSVLCEGAATFGQHSVGRALVLGDGMRGDPVGIPIGAARVEFDPVSDPSADPAAPLLRLQQIMRGGESQLSAALGAEPDSLVLADGPLTYVDPVGVPVVGVVKRFIKHYLDSAQEALVTKLGRGERTPLFGLGIGGKRIQRYSWYTRLVSLRLPWHAFAGIVRCEIGAGMNLQVAVETANQVTSLLPSFGGRATDPRAPQNLTPIGGLEAWLHHRLGDQKLLRRALTSWLIRQNKG